MTCPTCYGNHLLADGSGLTSAADAITDLLYRGEATDPLWVSVWL